MTDFTLAASSVAVLVKRLATVLSAFTAALVLTLLLQRFFPYPFLFLFFGAVMASGWFAGTAAGLLTVALSTIAVDYFFMPPLHSFAVGRVEMAYFVAFVISSLLASWISASKRKSEEALKQIRDELESRVSVRTAELIKTQAELAHLSQILSMGELAASISHEISQPITAVVAHGEACAQWLAVSPPNMDKAKLSVDRIIQNGKRAGAVLSRMRALFRMEAPAKVQFNINEVIDEMKALLRDEAAARGIQIKTALASGLPSVDADRIQLQQVVLNLMLNAMDPMQGSDGGTKELLITSRLVDSEILVSVEDSGSGIEADVAEKIFAPFFTTKPHGVGVGLSICRSILEVHEGRLWVTPRSRGGSNFQFALPVSSGGSDV